MSWLNFNDSLNSIKGQLSNLASNVLTEPDEDESKRKIKELEELVANQYSKVEELRKQNEELLNRLEGATKNAPSKGDEDSKAWSWNSPETAESRNADTEVADLKRRIRDLENENKELTASLEQLDFDCQQTTEKVINLKDALQTDYNSLTYEHEVLKEKYESLINTNDETNRRIKRLELEKENSRLAPVDDELINRLESLKVSLEDELKESRCKVSTLERECDELKRSANVDGDLRNEIEEMKQKLLEYETKIATYQSNRISDQEEYDKLSKLLQGYDDQVKEYREKYFQVQKENCDLKNGLLTADDVTDTKNYVLSITETFKKFMDYSLPTDEILLNENPFNSAVETVMKLLLELKWKSETLQKEVDSLTEEKTKILTEKKDEIERLLENSELLSQEVISKNEALRHYEEERRELMKNNDLLIAEVEDYRNNLVLQTIPETNEDNVVQLEAQLDAANKRIKELESSPGVLTDVQSELNYVNERFNIANRELGKIKKDYQDLLDMYNNKQLELNGLLRENEEMKISYERCAEKNESLSETVEKVRAEYENSEYKFNEINGEMEVLIDETGELRASVDQLKKANASLEVQCRSYEAARQELDELKRKLPIESEKVEQRDGEIRSLKEKLQNVKMSETTLKLQYDKDLQNLLESNKTLNLELGNAKKLIEEANEKLVTLTNENAALKDKLSSIESSGDDRKVLEEKIAKLNSDNESTINDHAERIKSLEKYIAELTANNNEMMARLSTKHEESSRYYNEIQRLNQIVSVEVEKSKRYEEEIGRQSNSDVAAQIAAIKGDNEKLQNQNECLRSQCEILAQNLLAEQEKSGRLQSERRDAASEREAAMSRELQRLREHLIEIEEMHTQEMMNADRKGAELQAKIVETEQREKEIASLHTSVSIRTNQHVETLQAQLQMVTSQRDELRRKFGDAEDTIGKQQTGLSNLEFVLRQFQEDKDKAVQSETQRIRKQIDAEKRIQDGLRKELDEVRAQLHESKQGLLAASRLGEQVETYKRDASTLKEEVQRLQNKLQKHEQQTSNQDAKVDKMLVKNLIVGFVSSNANLNKDQHQILKIIATVLDFNQQDNEKVKLNRPNQGSWLSSIVHPAALAQNQELSQESLSQAFVRFLENESKPRQLPNLLADGIADKNEPAVPQQQPVLLSEVVLPTFADFGQSRNSSSILKDILKDNN